MRQLREGHISTWKTSIGKCRLYYWFEWRVEQDLTKADRIISSSSARDVELQENQMLALLGADVKENRPSSEG